jgi:hypothetical protein
MPKPKRRTQRLHEANRRAPIERPRATHEADPCDVDGDRGELSPELRERIDGAARRAFGGPIEAIVPPGELREMLYQVFTRAINRKPRPIPRETMDFVRRCRAAGMDVSADGGTGHHRKPLHIKRLDGQSVLTDAILEQRYGCE